MLLGKVTVNNVSNCWWGQSTDLIFLATLEKSASCLIQWQSVAYWPQQKIREEDLQESFASRPLLHDGSPSGENLQAEQWLVRQE